MAKSREFKSVFEPYIISLIRLRQSCGFIYEAQSYELSRFDKFCVERGVKEPILSQELVNAWFERRPAEGGSAQRGRTTPVRHLAMHMVTLGKEAYIPRSFTATEFNMPYIPSKEEILCLFNVADNYGGYSGCCHHMVNGYRIAFRLMYCCGLRLSECCDMQSKDIDLKDATLFIRHSKGDKDRLVYVSFDLMELVERHLFLLKKELGFESGWLLPGRNPENHLDKTTLCVKFTDFWQATPYAKTHKRHPTCHSLRHAFVVERMNSWMKEGVNLSSMMPYLSAYLGHSCPNETMYYYHQVKEAFEIVRQKDTLSSSVIPEVVQL